MRQERAKSLSKRKAVFEAFPLAPRTKAKIIFVVHLSVLFPKSIFLNIFTFFQSRLVPVPCRDRENKIKVPRFAFLRESNLLKAIMQIENSAFLDFLRGLTHSPAFRLRTIVLRVLHYFHLYFIARRYELIYFFAHFRATCSKENFHFFSRKQYCNIYLHFYTFSIRVFRIFNLCVYL